MRLHPALPTPLRRILPGATALALVVLASPGCFRATGTRPLQLTVEEIPATGGRRVGGLKSSAGPGDFYMGNDFVEIAVDGSRFGQVDTQLRSGSIVDASYIGFDTNYQAVSMPGDQLERLSVVVNQDPDLPVVFDRFQPTTNTDPVRLEAYGHVLDPKGKLGLPRDAYGRVTGLSVRHVLTLAKLDRFITLETTLSNTGSAEAPVRSVGDFLAQTGGGFRVVVPASEDLSGRPLSDWGVVLPGQSFEAPLDASVKAPLVVFMGNEPGAATLDSHSSLGLLPLDEDQLAVIADPQPSLTEFRPRFAARVVVGKVPSGNLGGGGTLTYRRRLYIGGGYSSLPLESMRNDVARVEYLSAQGTGLQNQMMVHRSQLWNFDLGLVGFDTFGTATSGGSSQTEFRFERNVGTEGAPNWKLERVEWRELGEVYAGAVPPTVCLPTGTYRVIVRNREQSLTVTEATNVNDAERQHLKVPIRVEKHGYFQIKEHLAPERDEVMNEFGTQVFVKRYMQLVSARGYGRNPERHLQPARIFITGTEGAEEPALKRTRYMGGFYNAITKRKDILGMNYGAYQFRAGNEVFGSAFMVNTPASLWTPPGRFDVFCARGPLSHLDWTQLESSTAQPLSAYTFIVVPAPLPSGWTAFDIPGPTQATTGGLLPSEMLSSALAEGVNVVALAELDRHVSAKGLRDEYRSDFLVESFSDEDRSAIGNDPLIVAGRATNLDPALPGQAGFGSVVALFVPEANTEKRGGARNSVGWTLADFLAQSQGAYHVIRRPRDPENGLFTLQGFRRDLPLGQGDNAWWNATGPVSGSTQHGRFDALELLHAEGFDPANPAPWFQEFKTVRADWFAILNQQTPDRFTKGLGCSAALYSHDTPVGLARTYLKTAATPAQDALDPVLQALRTGALVASTGPLLDVAVNGAAPGGSASAAGGSVTVSLSLYAPDWLPVDEVRIVANGQVVHTIPASELQAGADWRQRTGTLTVQLPSERDAWVVVEAGVPLDAAGLFAVGQPWGRIMRGIYPIAVTNPVFLDLNGGGYTPPGL